MSDDKRDDKLREIVCGHGKRWTRPCRLCNRTKESMRVNAFVRSLEDELRRYAKDWRDANDGYAANLVGGLAGVLEKARIEYFGKGGE